MGAWGGTLTLRSSFWAPKKKVKSWALSSFPLWLPTPCPPSLLSPHSVLRQAGGRGGDEGRAGGGTLSGAHSAQAQAPGHTESVKLGVPDSLLPSHGRRHRSGCHSDQVTWDPKPGRDSCLGPWMRSSQGRGSREAGVFPGDL